MNGKIIGYKSSSIRLKNPHTNEEWQSLLEQIIDQNESEDQYIYLHITRGVAKRDHAFPIGVAPTIFIMSNPLLPPPAALLETGVSAITAVDNRWVRCDVKAISLLPNVLLRQLAVDAHAVETILIRDGFLTEGAASNIFVVKNNVMLAPPKSNLMLPGITYDVVLEFADHHIIPHEVRQISEKELQNADEIVLTSSTKDVLPITTLNEKSINNGKPGVMFNQTLDLIGQNPEQHIMVSSFNLASLVYAHQYKPAFPLVYNFETHQTIADARQLLNTHAFLHGLCLPIENLDRTMVDVLRDQGKCVAVYTCNSDTEINQALQLGVDILISDLPHKALMLRDQ